MRYAKIMTGMYGPSWAMRRESLEMLSEIVLFREAGGRFSAEEIAARTGGRREAPQAQVAGGIVVIPLYGMIMPRANMISDMSGLTTAESFGRMVSAAAADSSIGQIVLDIDSPGGYTSGLPEAADAVYAARQAKPVTAVANLEAASAAYWIASAASSIVVSPSAEVGSIGVWSMHVDESAMDEKEGVKRTVFSAGKYKTEGNPWGPMDEEAKAHYQGRVDADYAAFVGTVARNRGRSVQEVLGNFGQGRMVDSQEAVRRGMADRIATLDQVLAGMGIQTSNRTAGEQGRKTASMDILTRRQKMRERDAEKVSP